MTTAHETGCERPGATDAAGTAVRRLSGQGEEVAFASFVDAIRDDPRAGDLDQRIVDAEGHALAEVDGRLVVQIGYAGKGYVSHCWLDQLGAVLARADGESCKVVRVLPEWRFTVAGLERLALEEDAARSARRVA